MWTKIKCWIKQTLSDAWIGIKKGSIDTWNWIKGLHIPTKQELVDFANNWFPRDAKYIKIKNTKRFPFQTVLIVCVTAVSLFLIVFSSIFVSYNARQVMALEEKLEALKQEEEHLEDLLVLKNDPVMLSQMATELGMIPKVYVEHIYEDRYIEEKVIVYTTKKRGIVSFVDVICDLGLVRKSSTN